MYRVPIVKCIGLARGLLVWGVTNMITGWFVSLMGLLGQPPAQITNRFMNYLGVIFCVSCVFISSFIKNEEEEKEDIPRRVSSVGNLSTAVISVSNDPEPLIPVTDNGTSWVDRLSSSQRKLVGYGLSIFAGLMYGVNFDPCDYACESGTRTHTRLWIWSSVSSAVFCSLRSSISAAIVFTRRISLMCM